MWGKYCYVGQQTSLCCLHGLTIATAKYKAETAGVIIEGAKAVVPTQLPNCLPTLHVNKILLNSELKSNLFDKCLLTNRQPGKKTGKWRSSNNTGSYT